MTENQKDKKDVIKEKSVCNCYLLPTSDISDFHHYHQTSPIPYLHHCNSKNSHSKVKSLQDLPELSYKLAPRHNYSPYPGANSLNQLLPHRDNEIYTYPCESLQNCENCGQSHYPFTEHFKIGSKYLRINRQAVSHEGNYVQSPELVQEKREMPVATLLYRSRSLPQLSIVHDSGLGSVQDNGPVRLHSKLVADLRQLLTLKQHYYPEGGWGWLILVVGVLVQILSSGIHGAAGISIHHVAMRFNVEVYLEAGWLGAMSTGVALLVSPVTIAFCRKKSTRVTAVLGGLVTALGCLFTSFASQFHQLFFSYGTVVGIGVGITRDCSTLMVAQYFKRKREFVEIFIVSGSGLGIAVMSAFIKGAIGKIGWRLGLQAVTGVVFLTFILGTFYRSASLYHPQRRAILHLKNQKRKIKEKNKVDDEPPFFDFTTLKSKTVRILLISTGISAFGITTPIFYLAHQVEEEGLGDTVIFLQAYLGLGWTVGCMMFGLLVVNHNVECKIARQYLMQTAVFICGLCILALTTVHGNYHGYVMFTWIYGIFCGGYHYSLKMYTYERVRARNFARTWGFVQCSQAIPIAIGVPISGYINISCGDKAGYYFSSTCVLVGSFTLFFIDLHRRNLSKNEHSKSNAIKHSCESNTCPQKRRLSFNKEPENDRGAAGSAAAAMARTEHPSASGEIIDNLGVDKPELTCISEEGIADMDLPDNILDDMDYIGDCITSCNKVENYLMLSEFENNLIAEMPIIMDRKGRRWSLAKAKGLQTNQSNNNPVLDDEDEINSKWRLMSTPMNNRAITVIDEASTSHVEN
ncbi:monocarboxylate transporter 10-like isoform X1 [Chelonus insularis]|uniref:monocarboxylate transporter 10-like isoform X1 n=1 Tax=Chelonus insularis TaxID=460826 RepID=UPI00158ABB6F|nr:monocarboxylate transporter 10-like isoform X1 [Chelonus insularis]